MIVVEVLGRGGRVEERVRLAQLPATIGRGYGSDVVVDDRYADAAHARLSEGEGGTIVVEDLGSVNGLVAGEHGARAERLVLRPGGTFRVGHTLVRVVTTDLALAPALQDAGAGSRWRRLTHQRGAALLLTLIGAPLFGLALYLGSSEKTGTADYALDVLGATGALLGWAAVWALGTRIRSGRARFLAHLSVAWLVIGFALVVGEADEWLRFFAAGSWFAGAGSVVSGVTIVVVVLYGHLAVASRLSRATRVVAGLGAAAAVFGLAALGASGGLKGHKNDIVIDMPLKPVPVGIVPTETADAFLARAASLQRDADREAEQP